MRGLAGMLLIVLLALAGGPASAKPERIVSINLCADQLLLELAAPERIAALSFLAVDPAMSYRAEEARAFPVLRGGADEVILLEPDLVLAGSYTTRITVALLKRLGLPVVELPPANSLAEVQEQIRIVAQAIGEPARGERLIDELDTRLAGLARPEPATRPVAAVYQANGYTAGADTLIDDVLRLAGFDNLSPRVGLGSGGYLPLESLIFARPDFLILESTPSDSHSLAHQLLNHPALTALIARTPSVEVPSRLWICGGPSLIEAAELLVRSAQDWAEGRGE